MTDIAGPAVFYGALAAESFGEGGQAPLILLHGLSFDRGQWGPLIAALAAAGSKRRIVAFDLPGHGDSPKQDSYHAADVAQLVHAAATEAELTGTGPDAPTVVGHSIGAALATTYAATYPARAVVNIDQPLKADGFARMLRSVEPVLRGPDYGSIWETLLAGMGVDELPSVARRLVTAGSTPRQDLLLGYWDELLTVPLEELEPRRLRELDAIRARGTDYRHISGYELDPAYRAWFQAALPEAVITVLPGGGHFPHLAHPEQLAGMLR